MKVVIDTAIDVAVVTLEPGDKLGLYMIYGGPAVSYTVPLESERAETLTRIGRLPPVDLTDHTLPKIGVEEAPITGTYMSTLPKSLSYAIRKAFAETGREDFCEGKAEVYLGYIASDLDLAKERARLLGEELSAAREKMSICRNLGSQMAAVMEGK